MASTLSVPVISLRDFDNRRSEIIKELLEASESIGFFSLVDHGITVEEIEAQFAISKAYFALPHEVKGEIPHQLETNDGWEYKKQVRAETPNTVDQKESFWLKRNSQWPTEQQVPGFKTTTDNFISKCAGVSAQVLTCLSIALGFEEDFFNKAMNVNAEDNQTQLRMIHYMPSDNAVGTWRAGAHTDIGCLTLLFQRDGEDGLEVLPGREAHNSGIGAGSFSPIPAKTGPIVVNIGDMMMAWSDDRFKANYHRVRAKDVGKSPARYSIAYFNTGRKDVVLQGPLKKYPALTCGEYFLGKTKLHFGKQDALEKEKKKQTLPKASAAATVTPLSPAITV